MTAGSDPINASPLPRERAASFTPRNARAALAGLTRRRRFVRFMKFILPLIALGTVAAVIAWPQLSRKHNVLPLTFNDVDSANAALVMSNPRYRGNDSSGQPYVVTADRAVQDPQDDKQVTLDRVQADITMVNGEWWSLTADTGLYQGSLQLLDLYGNIAVFGDKGYEMHGHSAEINLETKVISSDEKVWGHAALGKINANGMRIYDSGQRIVFINGVKTTIFPREQRG
ncbi:MAG: LPS export ABC transporter periplasmic protein LptC [Ferrovibrio sp.]|uniref:LPS export ABC transporter periplasmic protein LptC n=1 Tax=Ferrovibrio sp. TaxID=1917215 RepID=UPI00391D9DB0